MYNRLTALKALFRIHAILPVPLNENSLTLFAKATKIYSSWENIGDSMKIYLGYVKDQTFGEYSYPKAYGWKPVDHIVKNSGDR